MPLGWLSGHRRRITRLLWSVRERIPTCCCRTAIPMSDGGKRKGTATSHFGVSRREAHDSSAFYERFPVPKVDDDDQIAEQSCLDRLWVGDARDMDAHGDIADVSVGLVVTSPPYFVGKEYERDVGKGHVPADYLAYLEMLHDVFAECVRKLEPGGRIAVNVANLGRRPYRSLSADVIGILQDRLGLLLRGEVIWRKGRGSNGSSAWGSFQLPSNPVLRDLTERIVIASKGRFDRAHDRHARARDGSPHVSTIDADEFMESVMDVWEMRPESASRVGHPAPFPVALPQRLIDLYTYRGDLVLDPFMGSGTTAVAAVRTGRHYVGFDTDQSYVALARKRIAAESERVSSPPDGSKPGIWGKPKVRDYAKSLLEENGWLAVRERERGPCGLEFALSAKDQNGKRWLFDVVGAFSAGHSGGLQVSELLWQAIGKASVLRASQHDLPLVLLVTGRPSSRSGGHKALNAVVGEDEPIKAVIDMLDENDLDKLAILASSYGSSED